MSTFNTNRVHLFILVQVSFLFLFQQSLAAAQVTVDSKPNQRGGKTAIVTFKVGERADGLIKKIIEHDKDGGKFSRKEYYSNAKNRKVIFESKQIVAFYGRYQSKIGKDIMSIETIFYSKEHQNKTGVWFIENIHLRSGEFFKTYHYGKKETNFVSKTLTYDVTGFIRQEDTRLTESFIKREGVRTSREEFLEHANTSILTLTTTPQGKKKHGHDTVKVYFNRNKMPDWMMKEFFLNGKLVDRQVSKGAQALLQKK